MEASNASNGRHARRERTRSAVLAAMFELVDEGKVPPRVEDVAERSGVSVSSIFRNFDGLDDMQRQALEASAAQTEHLFLVDDAEAPRSDRVRAHVAARIQLMATAGNLLRIGRARALDHEPLTEGLARLRQRLADQTRRRFATELKTLSPAAAANLCALIDASTSPEAFEVMSAAHARSPRQITTLWVGALDALLEQHVPDPTNADPTNPDSTGKESSS